MSTLLDARTVRELKCFLKWKADLEKFPDQSPVCSNEAPHEGFSGVFLYQPVAVDFKAVAAEWFPDRNKTFRRKFNEYASFMFSAAVGGDILADGNLATEMEGAEIYSLNLKKICRNYALFNELLIKNGILEVLALYDADKMRCIRYAISRDILRKGVTRKFLTENEKTAAIQGISCGTDTTDLASSPIVPFYADTLQRVQVDETRFKGACFELSRFQRVYPHVIRQRNRCFNAKVKSKEGRFYANYVNAPKEFRSLLKKSSDESLVEGDIAASHFHFLLSDMQDDKERESMKADLLTSDPYLSMCSHPTGVGRAELKESAHKFRCGSRAAGGYDSYPNGLFYKNIRSKYPKFAETMAAMPIFGAKQRSSFACRIMKDEASVMVQMVGARCRDEDLIYLPIHDGFLTIGTQYERVCEIIRESFLKTTGSFPLIRRK